MSYSSNPSTSNGVTPGQSGHHVISPQAIQSAISTHQYNSAQIEMIAPGNELIQLRIDLDAAYSAYVGGQMSVAEYKAVRDRLVQVGRDLNKRRTDYFARERAGQTKPIDWFKDYYGCTEEEAQKRLDEGNRLIDIQSANRARSQSRLLQQSRPPCGH